LQNLYQGYLSFLSKGFYKDVSFLDANLTTLLSAHKNQIFAKN